MDFIWPPRSCCEIQHYSSRLVHACCKRRSISDQIAKVQPLTANAFCPKFRSCKKGRHIRLSVVRLVLLPTICHTLCGRVTFHPIEYLKTSLLNENF